MGGTSGACPEVAGIAALVMARWPRGDTVLICNLVSRVREIIKESAIPIPGPSKGAMNGKISHLFRANAYRAMLSIIHGDVNNDGVIDVLDLTLEINISFRGGHAVLDVRTADVNCDGIRGNILDVTYLINHVYKGGPAPMICFRY